MKKRLGSRLLSWLLVLAILSSFSAPVGAVPAEHAGLSFERVDGSAVSAVLRGGNQEEETDAPDYADTDLVRVSIVLEKRSTIDAGFSTMNIAENGAAMSYREGLKRDHTAVTSKIEAALDKELDVVWNLTLAANLISANVAYGQIEKIRTVPGVERVVVETRYEPDVASVEEAGPNMATSCEMIGTIGAWAEGYTGAGSRIAVIDTGIDTDHQSFSAEGLDYALARQAEREGKELPAYLEGLNLLDAEEIEAVLDQLNVFERTDKVTAQDLYVSTKIPFGYNYIDTDLDITHDYDLQGEHGSHVEGIAAANAYIPAEDGTFVPALEAVQVQGVAPDAQILAMKVFGKGGGAYDSDYIAAIEDAIVLGCDAINLSLGSGNPGFSHHSEEVYQTVLENLVQSDTVVTISAGNSGSWAGNALPTGYLYADDVSMDTSGSPGSYTNSLGVASVDNDGFTGNYLKVGEDLVFYNESTGYRNQPMSTIAGEQKYIYIDGTGTTEEFAALAGSLEGKIAVCARGSVSFAEKANAAAGKGAIAMIVYNNEPGTIAMDLTGYFYTAPCISITQADGALLKAAATPVSDESGNVLGYEGTLSVETAIDSVAYHSEYYTMSDFSSWGIPGDLSMKPEITAPGGSIYSVDGSVAGGTAYESMSGTSMAAPQMAGMAAVVAQYMRENGLAEQTGMSPRHLAQSLLMSTAEPLREEASGGNYWSVLKQGSGLANVANAIAANSYIVMDASATASAADGKVKVELGDDPQREGVYDFSFSVHNMSKTAKTYTLGADFFTQDLFEHEEAMYMDTRTTPLAAKVTYLVDGAAFVPTAEIACDLDQDGDTDADDAQVILNYVAGLEESIGEQADVDGDGKVTSYDAYCILDSLETREITVEPGESAQVAVQVILPQTVKEALDEKYENGAYLEGYVYVWPTVTPEGEIGDVTHSVPILGYYGSWSEPSMFDKVSYTSVLYGDTTVPYTGATQTNNLVIRYSGDANAYYQVGNPYLVEETYPEGRAAINSADTLYRYKMSLIRNAAALTVFVADENGKVLDLGRVASQVTGAYYYANAGAWQDTVSYYNYNRRVSALGVREGDVIQVGLIAIPEYYADHGSLTEQQIIDLIESGALGDGAYLTTTLTVDNTAPEIRSITKDLLTGDLIVTAGDNQYIAAVEVLNAAGTKVLAGSLAEQDAPGQTVSTTVDLSQAAVGPNCLVVVADYAGNESIYRVAYGGEPEDYSGRMYGFTSIDYRGTGPRWFEINPETLYYFNTDDHGGTENVAGMDIRVDAAEYVDGYVYMAAEDGYLYAAEQGEWASYEKVGYYGNVTKIQDMAYNYADGKLYALGEQNTIYSVDCVTGKLTKEYTVDIQIPTTTASTYNTLLTLAIDDDGNFYSVNYGSYSKYYTYLYRWSAGNVADGAITGLTPVVNTSSGYVDQYCRGKQSMAWDHNQDVLYWANCDSESSSFNNLLTFDMDTGKAVKANPSYANGQPEAYASRLYVQTTGLYVVPSGNQVGGGSASEATEILLDQTELTLLWGAQTQIVAEVYPWTLTDKSITWSSSDEAVATVENGTVTAVACGEAVITATTNAKPQLRASCTITVRDLDPVNLKGLIRDAQGDFHWSEFTSDAPEAWKAVSEKTADYYGGTICDGTLYVHDGMYMYGLDPDSFEATQYGAIAASWLWSDAAAAPLSEDGYFGKVVGLCNGGTVAALIDPKAGSLSYWDLSYDYSTDPLAAIAYVKSGTYDYSSYNKDCPACFYYVLTEGGELWEFVALTYNKGKTYYLARKDLGNIGIELMDTPLVTAGAYASLVYDEATGYLVLASYEQGKTAQLYAIDPETCILAPLGEFGQNVYPVTALYQYNRVTELTVRLNTLEAEIYAKDTVALSARVLPVVYQDAVTWSSSDPSIATVDANGLVTGVAEGTAVITATSVDHNDAGQTASASCTVTVKGLEKLDTKVHAQVTTQEGIYWATIDTSDLSQFAANATASVALTGGGMHDGKIYGTDSNFEDMCGIYQIDPANGFQETLGGDCSPKYAMLDATTAPELVFQVTDANGEEVEVSSFGYPIYIASDYNVQMMQSFEEGTIDTTFPTSYYYEDLAAICYVGTTTYNGVQANQWLVLSTNGDLHSFVAYGVYYKYSGTIGYDLVRSVYGNIGMGFQDAKTLSMAYVCDGSNEGVVIANSGETTELYYVDLKTETLTAGKLGNIAGATAISSLYTDVDFSAKTVDMTVRAGTAEIASTPIRVAEAYGAEPMEAVEAHLPAGEAEGSTHALQGAAVQKARPAAAGGTDVTATDGAVVLSLKEDQAVTNGLLRVTYDPEVLTFEGVDTLLGNFAVNADEKNGVILFDYATATAVPSDTTLAALNFTYSAAWIQTKLTVETLQRNTELAVENETLTAEVTYEAGGHDWSDWITETEADCFHDGVETRTCARCGQTETRAVPANSESCPSGKFTDLNTAQWYHRGVDYALKQGLMQGMSSTQFQPDGILTRAQMVTVLYRLAGSPEVTEEAPFTDVAEGQYYTVAVAWGYVNGIVQGVTETAFAPNAPTTREQMVTFLARYAAGDGLDVTAAKGDLSRFPDAGSISEYAAPFMSWAVEQGIINGVGDRLAPRATATRAQVATILLRYSEIKA